ncbi:MAG: peptidoglycan DD-metalloendopeptidase family protein [Gammaproteobacteria bacterium]|nr:peptidoglycan DD-metalloendopeptidase family protein [Gammaproteobacteria bacterium]
MALRSRLQLAAFLMIAGLILSACSSSRFVAYGEGRYSSNNKSVVHVVRKSETLYSIAWQYGYDFRKLAQWNKIPAPYTIYPKQRIKLYKKQGEWSEEKTEKKATAPQFNVSKRINNKSAVAGHTKATAVKTTIRQKVKWHWPTKGKIISHYSATDPGKKGLDIAGKMGQPVRAAASGVVVYSGNGLRGYGNLIIIKHNETYFSAYAHNQEIHVKENEKVKFGQKIADMGSTDTDKPMLHFEIRRNGKPSNPMKYLPKNSYKG